MSFLTPYYSLTGAQAIQISAQQGNDFAKQVADDFNPIHHTDSKRFCVPGDLLFAIALDYYGVRESMQFSFKELIKADAVLNYPSEPVDESAETQLEVLNERGKSVLGIEFGGAVSRNDTKIEQLIRNYVVFSGQNFPGILVPLMQQHDVMINPARPLVIYESMSLHFDDFDFTELKLDLVATKLEVEGKRGNAQLDFALSDQGREIGTGHKRLVLSGLREYEQEAVDDMCNRYLSSKQAL